jgi:putative peptidoglycan lipid II flippase
MMKKFTATVAGATIFLIIISILSKGIGFLREVLFAQKFGLSEAFELYLVSAVFPIIITTNLYYIAQNYFIPHYNTLKESAKDKTEIVKQNFWIFVIGGIGISILLLLVMDPLLKFYLGNSYNDNKELVRVIYLIFISSIPFASGNSLLSAYLNAEFEFRIPAFSQVLLNIVVILMVALVSESLFIYSIPLGFLCGTILQFIFLVGYTAKKDNLNYRIKFNSVFSLNTRVEKSIIFIIIIEVVGQLYVVIDRWFYESVNPGGIAALNYAGTIFNLPISLISISFASVLLPYFSKNLIESDDIFIDKVINSLKINAVVFIPVTIILFVYGADIISLIFERGSFSRADTYITAELLEIFAIGLFFYSGYAILNKSLFARGQVKSILMISLIGVVIKIAMSVILVEEYSQEGLAMSTVLVYIFYFAAALILVIKSSARFLELFLHLFYHSLIAIFILFLVNIIDSRLTPGNLYLVLLYAVLYSISVYYLNTSYINKLNPFRKDI